MSGQTIRQCAARSLYLPPCRPGKTGGELFIKRCHENCPINDLTAYHDPVFHQC
jgi:hypothetical protein